jgi:tetratricopeptide (TPR) repeat protein
MPSDETPFDGELADRLEALQEYERALAVLERSQVMPSDETAAPGELRERLEALQEHERALAVLEERLDALQEQGRAMADVVVAVLPDARVAVIAPLLFGNYRLLWGPPGRLWYDPDSGFEYDSLASALRSADAWREGGFVGEPQGWYRHLSTGRRRPDGDPAKEYVQR